MASCFIIFGLLIVVASSQCYWTVKNPDDGSEITLDLTPLNGVIMNITDSYPPYLDYSYSVCQNNEICNDDNVMVMYTADQSCYILGRWDPSFLPEYQSTPRDTWTFVYDNGATDCGNPARTWSPKFICTPGIKYRIGNVTEIPNSCYYEVSIETEFACRNWTTTTTSIPSSRCIFKSEDGEHILNMTTIRGQLLSSQTNIHDMAIMYYPCMNSAKCSGNDVMAYLFDSENILCKQYLAIWEDGYVEPNYIESLEMWQFTYVNGQSCNGEQTVFNVEWVCDQSAILPVVVQAKEIAACIYQMIINSRLACN